MSDGNTGLPAMPHFLWFHRSLALTVVALVLLAAALPVAHPVSAQSQTADCDSGGAVTDPANNPGLVSDCEALLAARDTLAGTATLDWAANAPIAKWDGITAGGSPMRVTGLNLKTSAHLQQPVDRVRARRTAERAVQRPQQTRPAALPIELSREWT